VHLQNVSKSYKNGVNALNDITIDIKDGEFVYVIGETGSGKSTFIKLLDGELIPTKGIVEVNGVNVGKLRFSKVPKYRRNIGVVFQDYRLIESKTVFENIAFALEVINKPRKEIRQRVIEVLEIIDLEDKAKSFPSELSGGQQQRVTIGRAIANHPQLLIADEPTGNLDPERSNEIVELLEKINQESGTTVIMVTHDINLVNKYRKRTIKFEYGHVVSDSREGGYIAHV
ncbi:MAG: cell division ATP-binding protein FtsE, partial [Erysipelotrichaceae bacterium]|nr:cell division ATP-binding protein FtsE [Erysipelotrichaceae bacterium]